MQSIFRILVDSVTSSSGYTTTSSGLVTATISDGTFFMIFGGAFLVMVVIALIPVTINLIRDRKAQKKLKEDLERESFENSRKDKK